MDPSPLAIALLVALAALAAAIGLAAAALLRMAAELGALAAAIRRLADRAPELTAIPVVAAPAPPTAAPSMASSDTPPPAHAAAPSPAPPPELTVEELQARVLAAQEAGDVEGLLAHYDQLAPRLAAGERGPFDARLLRWFLDRLMRRMRGGTVGVDVATLAARIADRFPATKEGAALRASLPTLRRSAGLCADCAEPYNGDEDVCPDCMARRPESGPRTLPIAGPWPDDEPAEDEPAPAAT